MIKKIIKLLENALKCSKTARNICCSARKLLELYAAQLGSDFLRKQTARKCSARVLFSLLEEPY